jgi:hypothetical protein
MATFRVLDLESAADRSAWIELWKRWPAREPAGHPSYVSLFARPQDRVLCASARSGEGSVLFPFIARPLSGEPWAAVHEKTWDLTTAYGYSGPFAWSFDRAKVETFWDAFDAWAAANHVVTSFARLSLFPDQLIAFRGEVAERFPNVIRELESSLDEIWRGYAHKVRKNVNRARQRGLRVERDSDGSRLEDFLSVYLHTMDRRQATELYYFDTSFFRRLTSELPSSVTFFHVLDGSRVISSELVLVSEQYAYSFLGGTLGDAFELRPNDLLKHEIIGWAKEVGKKSFVLGGGYGAADGIFKYKLGFAPLGERPFCIGMRVFDEAECERLIAQRRAWERKRGKDWEPSANFFPAYRS